MGHLQFPSDDIGPGVSGREPAVTLLTVVVDYRPHMEQVDLVQLELPHVWGGPRVAHLVLTQMFATRERVELVDTAGDTWPFYGATVRAFWTRD